MNSIIILLVASFVILVASASDPRSVDGADSTDDATLEASRSIVHGYVSSLDIEVLNDHDTLKQVIQQVFGQEDSYEFLLQEAIELAETRVEEEDIVYADRFVQSMLDLSSDPDCMTREFDATSDDFDEEEVAKVLKKCRVVVVRKAYKTSFLDSFKADLTKYIGGLHTGKVSSDGITNNNEDHIINHSAKNRWEILLPRELVNPDLIGNEYVQDILSHDILLGEELTLHSYGMYMSTPGAPGQNWHQDDVNLFGDYESVEAIGLGAVDLPPHAITLMIPMVNLTAGHGPTEFCMGSHALGGLNTLNPDSLDFRNEQLRTKLKTYMNFHLKDACPPEMWRAPTLDYGDIGLFDYSIVHRGGWNQMPEARTATFATFSRFWFKDGIFNDPDEEGDDDISPFMNQMLRAARVAIPDGWEDETSWNKLLEDDSTDAPERLEDYIQLYARNVKTVVDDDERRYARTISKFIVSNVDVGSKHDPLTLYHKNEEIPFEIGNSVVIEAYPRDLLEVKSANGLLVKSWTVKPLQDQLVLSTSNTETFQLTPVETLDDAASCAEESTNVRCLNSNKDTDNATVN